MGTSIILGYELNPGEYGEVWEQFSEVFSTSFSSFQKGVYKNPFSILLQEQGTSLLPQNLNQTLELDIVATCSQGQTQSKSLYFQVQVKQLSIDSLFFINRTTPFISVLNWIRFLYGCHLKLISIYCLFQCKYWMNIIKFSIEPREIFLPFKCGRTHKQTLLQFLCKLKSIYLICRFLDLKNVEL